MVNKQYQRMPSFQYTPPSHPAHVSVSPCKNRDILYSKYKRLPFGSPYKTPSSCAPSLPWFPTPSPSPSPLSSTNGSFLPSPPADGSFYLTERSNKRESPYSVSVLEKPKLQKNTPDDSFIPLSATNLRSPLHSNNQPSDSYQLNSIIQGANATIIHRENQAHDETFGCYPSAAIKLPCIKGQALPKGVPHAPFYSPSDAPYVESIRNSTKIQGKISLPVIEPFIKTDTILWSDKLKLRYSELNLISSRKKRSVLLAPKVAEYTSLDHIGKERCITRSVQPQQAKSIVDRFHSDVHGSKSIPMQTQNLYQVERSASNSNYKLKSVGGLKNLDYTSVNHKKHKSNSEEYI